MSRHFLLNLANRSANKAAIPMARPHLSPVFMPPAPSLPIAAIQAVPPAAQKKTQTTQQRPLSYSTVTPGQTIPETLRRREPPPPSPSAQSSPPEPLSMDARPVVNEPAVSVPAALRPMPDRPENPGPSATTAVDPVPKPDRPMERVASMPVPAEPSREPSDRSPRPGRKHTDPNPLKRPANITRSIRLRPDDSGEQPPLTPSPPPGPQAPVLPTEEKFQIRSKSPAAVTEEEKKTSATAKTMPAPAISIEPNVSCIPSIVERIASPGRQQPHASRQPPSPQTATPEAQTPAPEVMPAPAVVAEPRQMLVSAKAEFKPTSGSPKPGNGDSATVPALPPTTLIERSTFSVAPGQSVQPEPPAPVKIERVAPAPAPRPSMQPLHMQGSRTPPIQVSIGTIDLRVQSSETPRRQPSYRRRRPQGFDGFRQRRSYSGWELGHE